MADPIRPVAKTLCLCEEIDVEWGMTNLYGLLTYLRPASYPHVQDSLCAFIQLGQGLGDVRFHIDVIRARDERLVRSSNVRMLTFRRRTQTIQVALNLEGIRFEEPGVYLVQAFCDNTWVGDVTLELREDGNGT